MRYLLSTLAVIYCHLAIAQSVSPSQQYEVHTLDNRPVNYFIMPTAEELRGEISETKALRLIVKLRTPVQTSSGRVAADVLEKEHQQFVQDFSRLSNSLKNARSSVESQILYEYKRAWNGFTITTSASVAEALKKLPYVSAVTEDKQVKTTDVASNQAINAPQVWSQFGFTGKNIRIGIIDTGIDYLHPDLGGGFGPAHKVIGGYDFVNEDNDPMDDHGHGTHVAGIAAAKGVTLKGVAPDAKLVAYKVLSQGGSGFDSWILAAIERCVDPDQNPNTNDALEVVNMSLGRYADPDEPLSEAVNNAVAQGVVFVIAAGNSAGYMTIGTPAIAAEAITVGATDNYKFTAHFSSKGPTEKDLLIKPEVAAPGVNIYSSFPNGKYSYESGTSMASPHVAGAVALLLEKNPDWTPATIKAALVGSATSMYPNIFDQGAGVIDIYKAITAGTIITPSCLNLGIPEASGISAKQKSITVHNYSSSTKSYNLSIEGSIVADGINISIAPASFSLDPGASQVVEIIFTIDGAALPLKNLPEAYTGTVLVNGGSESAKVIVSLPHPRVTRFNFTGELPYNFIVVGIEGSYYWKPYTPKASMDLFLPMAKYDIITHYSGYRTVITEGVNTAENTTITIDKSLAKNRIVFQPVDKNNNRLLISPERYGLVYFGGEDRNIITWYTSHLDTLYVSDQLHYRYDFKYHGRSSSAAEYYEVTASTGTGITDNMLLQNDPAAFSSITFHNPSIGKSSQQGVKFYIKAGSPWTWLTSWHNSPVELPNGFTLLQSQHEPGSQGLFGTALNFKPLHNQPGYTWETADIRTEKNNQLTFYRNIISPLVSIQTTSFQYYLGESLPAFMLHSSNTDTKVSFRTPIGHGGVLRSLGEREQGTTYYKIVAGETMIKEGSFANPLTEDSGQWIELDTPAGLYRMEFEYSDFQVGGKFGKAIVKTTFNTSNEDKNPPGLSAFHLIANNRYTNHIDIGEAATFHIRVIDYCHEYYHCHSNGTGPAVLKIRAAGEQDWIELNWNYDIDGDLRASLPLDLPAAYYEVLFTIADNAQNSFSYQLSPGFLIGPKTTTTPYTTINLLTPRNYAINAGTTPLFTWSHLAGETYTFQISRNSAFSEKIAEIETTEAQLKLPSALEENQTYYWRVGVKPNHNIRWSQVFQFESKILPVAKLIAPLNQSENHPLQLQFKWDAVNGANLYELQVSLDENFSSIHYNYFTSNTSAPSNYLFPNATFYWRVRSIFFGWRDNYESFSETFSFKTIALPAPVLLTPAADAKNISINPTFKWLRAKDADRYVLFIGKSPDLFTPDFTIILSDTSFVIHGLDFKTSYYWRVLAQFDNDNGYFQSTSPRFTFETEDVPTAVQENIPSTAYNYPNPFTRYTYIIVPKQSVPVPVTVSISDQLGKTITSFSIPGNADYYLWDGRDNQGTEVNTGLYHAIIKCNDKIIASLRLSKH